MNNLTITKVIYYDEKDNSIDRIENVNISIPENQLEKLREELKRGTKMKVKYFYHA